MSPEGGFGDLLRDRAAGWIELTPEQIRLLELHYRLLLKWNQILNLTRIESLPEAVERHYAEGLFLAAHLPRHPSETLPSETLRSETLPSETLRIADIGSGAGFPGFPVAVVRPDCEVTLIESHQRKAVFLREASRGMPNVRVLGKRAEEVGDRFDLSISRAVSYDDLAKPLQNLAPAAYLLTGGEEPKGRIEKIGFVWSRPIPLPWGASRFLRIGNRAVSRETGTA